ncbi:MAG: 5-oxoprolinase subunit B family protein [Friedmanniella sp.]
MTGAARIRRCGEEGLLVEVDNLAEVLDLAAAVRRAVAERAPGFEAVVDVLPAAATVLVTVAEGHGVGRLPDALAGLDVIPGSGARTDEAQVVEIPVRYQGPDLAEVASRTGLSPAEVVAAHTGSPWRVAFGGFAPGFAYLVGGDPRLRVPRRAEPRTAVPAGAVALAGEFSAVYPRSSPGGWQLLGQTDLAMWDVDRQPPALLQPGMVVRFVDAEG